MRVKDADTADTADDDDEMSGLAFGQKLNSKVAGMECLLLNIYFHLNSQDLYLAFSSFKTHTYYSIQSLFIRVKVNANICIV